jgi:hypothetical protein
MKEETPKHYIQVYIKSQDDLPKDKAEVIYFRPYQGIFEGRYIDARKEDWIQNVKWYLQPIEQKEISDAKIQSLAEELYPDSLGKQVTFCENIVWFIDKTKSK